MNNPDGGAVSEWKRVILADITPPEKREAGQADRGDSPLVMLAPDARAVAETADNRILLGLKDVSIYELGKEAKFNNDTSPDKRMSLQASRPEERGNTRPVTEMASMPLYRLAYRKHGEDPKLIREARVELNQRVALPLACLLLTLAGMPLGITSRRGGKSSAVILTMVIAFIYYIGMAGLNRMALEGAVRPELAVWLPNLAFMLLGMVMMVRLEFPGDRDYLARFVGLLRLARQAPQQRVQRAAGKLKQRSWSLGVPVLAQVIDVYVLGSFLFYFVLWLVSFVLMYHFFKFFELLSDMIKNNIPMSHMLSYHFFLTPRLVYTFASVAVLAAVLVVFGVMSKNNEVTAFKACGVSSYRLAAPVLLAGLFLSGALFAFDHYWLPTADRKQDQLYNEIKNKAPQTYLRPDHKWVYGLHDRVYYYKYFIQAEQAMTGVNVYEIDPVHWRLTRQIWADRAKWEPSLGKWVFENGWSRDFKGDHVGAFDPFPGATRTFAELEEKPDYFMKEKTQPLQMNFYQLRDEIAELKQSGFANTVALEVQLQKKFSEPLAALILALVSVPFAFSAGNRGGMAGFGISVIIFVAYFGLDYLFEQIGDLSQLSPAVAAWSPDVIFALVGLYFVARMRT